MEPVVNCLLQVWQINFISSFKDIIDMKDSQ